MANKEDKVILEPFNFQESIDPLVTLLQSNYDGGEIVNPKYLNWEYLENPSGTPVTIVAKNQDEELVGQYLVIPARLIISGKEAGGSLSLNTLTRADYRGRGLFTKMALGTYEICKNQDLKVTYGFPNPNSYPGFVRKLNFTHIGDAPIYFKPLNYWQIFYKKFIKKSKIKYGQDLLTSHDQTHIDYSKNGYDITSLNFNKDEDIYTRFWDGFKRLYPAMVDRSIGHLTWRYLNVPTRNYQLIKMVKDGKMLGYCSIRARQVFGLNSGFLVDFCCLESTEAIEGGHEMLRFVTSHFKKNKIDLIGCMMSEHTHEFKILMKSGFLTIPKKFLPHNNPVIVRINDDFPGSSKLLEMKSWFLTFGDYDVM